MADLKTTNIYGDAYINNKVGINTNTPATRLQIGQLSPTAATEGLQFGDDTAARLHRINSGHIRATGGISSATFLIADNYLQTNNNLIYPSSQAATQRLEVGNAANNAWIDGITIAPGGNVNVYNNLSSVNGYVYAGTYLQSGNSTIYAAGYGNTLVLNVGNASGNNWINGIAIAQGGNVTVYNNLTVNNNATVTNDLTVNGNTYLGNANGDTVYVNDTIRIGATDSGDASLFFGEGAVAGSDYGARWYWDSVYTFTWYTRNAGTDTALFDYVTNDLNYINWRRHFHMQNKEINYNAQVHFNAGTRFVGNNTSYLIFRSDSTGAGGIQVQDGSATNKGYTGYWDSAGGGILNNTGNWAVRYNFGNANSGGTLYGDWTVNANLTVTGITMTNLTGAYQNTTVYDSPKTQSATPSRGIRAPASSIQFTDSYAIAPSWTFRSTGDWPVPYGIGWGTGGESSGIFQRYHSNGSSFGDMIFYTGNDGYGAFSFRRHTWEGTTHFAAGSGELNTELFRIDWSGNLTMLGTLNGSANSATLYANNGSYGAWAINGTRNGWGGIEFANNGVSLMMGPDTVGFHQNTNGWLFRVYNGSGFIYKGSWGGGTAATILDSSNYSSYAGGLSTGNTFTNTNVFNSPNNTTIGGLSGNYGLTVYQGTAGTDAYMTFHIGSDFAGYFGLGGAENDLVWGGWSVGNFRYRILHSSNAPYAWNMNQYVRTTDTPTFAGVYTNLIGINDGGIDCYMEVTDSNPTFNYEAYGGEFYFYGDKSRPSSLLYVGGIDVSRTVIATAISSRDYTRQLFPGGGYYHEGGSVTGAIKIRLPANTKSVYPMLSFTCHIYNYSTGTSRTFKIGGHYSNTQWYNPFAYCLSDSVGNLNVRFGYEGTYLCVWIGETNSGWSYPTVFITDFQNGYSAIDGIWMTGWSVTRVTAFDTVTNGPYAPGYFWNQNNDGAGSGLDADLLDGYSSTTAGTANTIVLRDSSGHITGQYILGSYFNASAGNSENPTIGQIWTQNTSDNYLRKSTPAHFRSQVTDGSYPSLTGANASGTWSISITGNAATATTTDNINGRAFFNRDSGNVLGQDSYTNNGIGYVNGVSLYSQTDGGMYASAYSTSWIHQIYGDFRTGQIAIRGKNNGTWQSWRAVLDSSNYNSYAAALNGASNQNFNANSIYPYEWIRFMTDAGIYWQSGTYAGHHIYPQASWGMSFRSQNNSDCGLQLRGNNNTSLGAVYSDGTSIGFLTAAFGWGASFTLAGTMNRGTVPLARIETITAYTILGNNNASAAAVPSALSVATVATMLSGQTMNINGSSTSCSGTATTATTANALNTGNSYTISGLTNNGTENIFPPYAGGYSYFLRMGYDNSGNYDYTIKRNGTTGFLEFNGTQTNYVSYYFAVSGASGLGIGVSPSSRLHVNGDGTNPAIRVDNGAIVTGVASNSKTFYGFMPISIAGTTKYIQLWN